MTFRPTTRALAVAGVVATAFSATASPALAMPSHRAPVTRAFAGACAEPGEDFPGTPWSQLAVSPERVWPFATGAGVTVAVLSTGVDSGRAGLTGRVDPGFDALAGGGPADDDCLGMGTEIAGVIAAHRTVATGLTGLAPDARVLPVRVVSEANASAQGAEPGVMAAAIRFATAHGAQVIDAAVPCYTDSADLRAAVADAIAAGVVVVGAVGDLAGQGGGTPTPYPAAYTGVLGVGAIDPAGGKWQGSASGPYVGLVAPGVAVIATQRVSGFVAVNGTGVASGFVAATAALVRQHRPTASSADVSLALLATASPMGGPRSPDFGHGMVNPYAALTVDLVDARGVDGKGVQPKGLDPHRPGVAVQQRHGHGAALVAAAVVLVATVVALLMAGAMPGGRRHRWRATLAPPPAAPAEPQEPGPPVQLFPDAV
jgi:hypothetical protein